MNKHDETRDRIKAILTSEFSPSHLEVQNESHLHEGRQDIPADLRDLQYGVSVTDACMDWDTTETSLRELAECLRSTLRHRREA